MLFFPVADALVEGQDVGGQEALQQLLPVGGGGVLVTLVVFLVEGEPGVGEAVGVQLTIDPDVGVVAFDLLAVQGDAQAVDVKFFYVEEVLGEQLRAFAQAGEHGLAADDFVLYQGVAVDGLAVGAVVVPQIGLGAEELAEVAA